MAFVVPDSAQAGTPYRAPWYPIARSVFFASVVTLCVVWVCEACGIL